MSQQTYALITGASRGIGRATAMQLAAEGNNVILVSRKQEALTAVAQEIQDAGGRAFTVAAHLGNISTLPDLAAQISDITGGQLHYLVNNAATNPFFGKMHDISEAAFDKTMDVNFKGPFFLAKQLLPLMKSAGGSIVNVSSIFGHRPAADQGLYSITKTALLAFTKVQAQEYAPWGIRVNAVAPGLIKTAFAQALLADESMTQAYLSQTPAGRVGVPEDIARVICFLLSPAAGYVNGTCLDADGGFLA